MRSRKTLRPFGVSALLVSCAVLLTSGPHAVAADDAWGGAANGLRSRLVSDRAVYEAGQGVYLWLNVWNASTEPVEIERGEWMKRTVELIGPDGRRVGVAEKISSTPPWRSTVAPGRITDVLTISGARTFGVLPAGRYRARWEGATFGPEVEGEGPPPSNTVTFEIRPAPKGPDERGEVELPVPFGPPKNGLCTRLSLKTVTFRTGEPIPAKLEVRNIGEDDRSYSVPQAHLNGHIVIIDERGIRAPYVGGSFQTINPLKVIPKGATHELHAFDLASWYYLRRPGRYGVYYPGAGASGIGGDSPLPTSNVFNLLVLPNPEADDSDPVGRLLPLMKDGWSLSASRPWCRLVRPTGAWGRAPGRMMYFYKWHEPGKPGGLSSVHVWLTSEKAPPEPWQLEQPGSAEYVGEVPAGHLYVLSRFRRDGLWPGFEEDIKRALMKEP